MLKLGRRCLMGLLCLVVLLSAAACRAETTTVEVSSETAAESTREKTETAEKETETEIASQPLPEEEEVELTQADIESDTVQWFNACYALVTMNNYRDPTLIGGTTRDQSTLTAFLIGRDWGVYDRATAGKKLNWLLEEGHRFGYRKMVEELAREGVLELEEAPFMEWAGGIEEEKQRNRAITVYRTNREYGDRGIDAWDYCRAIQLLGDYYVCGFYSLRESMDASLPIAQKLQKEYHSWEDMVGSYLRGYQYWRGDDVNDPESASAMRQEIYGVAKVTADLGPYRLPWDLELKDTWSEAIAGQAALREKIGKEYELMKELPSGASPREYIELTAAGGADDGKVSYIRCQDQFYGVSDEGAYQYDMPFGWQEGYFPLDEKLNALFPGTEDGGIEVLVHIAPNEEAEKEFSDGWDQIVDSIRKLGEAHYAENVDIGRLAFQKYLVNGTVPMYTYTFHMERFGQPLEIYVCYRMENGYVGEFIGMGPSEGGYDVESLTRYIAASYEAFGGPPHLSWSGGDEFRGADHWDFSYLHNPFAIADYSLLKGYWQR